jgi:hypothetical protein
MQDLIDDFHLISYKMTYDNHEEYGWPYSPWQTHIWYIPSIKITTHGVLLLIPFNSDCTYLCKLINLNLQTAKKWS